MLVDKEIMELVKSESLITNFNEDNLGAISYDVVVDKFIIDDKEENIDEYLLNQSEYVYVKTRESLNMTNNLCCKIIEKNSLMRNGLKVDGPFYQPWHKTSIFLRVNNISKKEILLNRGMKIAQLVFLKLSDEPMKTYDKQRDAHYNDEKYFRN